MQQLATQVAPLAPYAPYAPQVPQGQQISQGQQVPLMPMGPMAAAEPTAAPTADLHAESSCPQPMQQLYHDKGQDGRPVARACIPGMSGICPSGYSCVPVAETTGSYICCSDLEPETTLPPPPPPPLTKNLFCKLKPKIG